MSTWSTGSVPRREQFAYWREMICQTFLDLTPESALRDGFRGKVTHRQLGTLDLGRIDSQAQRVRRTEADIDRSPRLGHYANLQVRGTCLTVQDGRATVQHPGDLAVVDTSRPFTFEFSDDFQQLSLHLPGRLLTDQLDGPVPTASRIPTVSGVGAALRHTLHALNDGDLTATASARLGMHASGLLAIALTPPPEPAEPRPNARLLDAALDDIAEHLTENGLSPAATATRLGISVRLLHQLFGDHERSFGGEVRWQRLEQAYRDLTDPARRALRIADIAAAAGFVVVTHFHRVFRQRYGRTPTEARRAED
jgi:AraC-like DNA-binding protein